MKGTALRRLRLLRMSAALACVAVLADVGLLAAQEAPEDEGLFKVTIVKPDLPEPDPSRFIECDFSNAPGVEETQRMIRRLAKAEDFPEDMLMAIARQESTFRMDLVSPAGAVGVMQLMPATAERFGVDRCKAEDNIRGAIRYLRVLQKKYENPLFVLAAYNAGETTVDRNRGIPPYGETLRYVAAVMSELYGWKPFDGNSSSDVAQTVAPAKNTGAEGKVSNGDKSNGQNWSQGFVYHVEE